MRGLSIDMAVFRDLLKLRLPRLSKHLDNLQFSETKEGSKGNQNYCIYICWKNLNIWFSLMMKDCEWMLLFCRYKFWTSIDKCIYNAVVSDPVFNLPSKRYRITCMGPYSSGRKWNTIENGPCDLERVRGVSRIFHIYIYHTLKKPLSNYVKYRWSYWILSNRRIIQAADTADEFYCVMGQLSQEMLEYKLSDSNKLIKVCLSVQNNIALI